MTINTQYTNSAHFVSKRKPRTRNTKSIKYITVHHSAVESNISTGLARLISYARYHMNSRKWPAVGYHYGILPNGKIYQLVSENYVTFHDSINFDSIGVVLSGHYGKQKPTIEMLQSLEFLLSHLQRKYKIAKENILTHSQRGKKACPGSSIEPYIREFNKKGKLLSIQKITNQINSIDMITSQEYIQIIERYPISTDFHRKAVRQGKPEKSLEAILNALIGARAMLERLKLSDEQKETLKKLVNNNQEIFQKSQLHLDAIENGVTAEYLTSLYSVILQDRAVKNELQEENQKLEAAQDVLEHELSHATSEASKSRNLLTFIRDMLNSFFK